MAKRPPKPPGTHRKASGATSQFIGGPRFLTSEQCEELRRKVAEVEAMLWQFSAAARSARPR